MTASYTPESAYARIHTIADVQSVYYKGWACFRTPTHTIRYNPATKVWQEAIAGIWVDSTPNRAVAVASYRPAKAEGCAWVDMI